MTISIPAEYPWVLAVISLTVFHLLIQGFAVGGLRRKFFTKEFFATHFPEIKEVPENGYPDMGQGRFADKLPLEQWTRFNNAQRAHYNYLEMIPLIVVLEAISGLFFARVTVIGGIIVIIGRQLYASGYRSRKGSRGRGIGAAVADIGILFFFGASLYGCFQAGGGVAGLTALTKF
jgi:glutathione S-transferase